MILTILQSAWTFARKHTVLGQVALWLITLPSFLIVTIERLTPGAGLESSPYRPFIVINEQMMPLLMVTSLLLVLIGFWGYACVLLVGRKLIQGKAGRNRSSFRLVRKEATKYILPLLLTNILYDCFVIFWSLIFLIPAALLFFQNIDACPISSMLSLEPIGILRVLLQDCSFLLLPLPLLIPALLYAARAFFFDIVIVTEKHRYRAALRKSQSAVRGRTGRTLFFLVATLTILFGPLFILNIFFEESLPQIHPMLLLGGDLLISILVGVATVLFLLCGIIFYGSLPKKRVQHVEL